MVAALNPRNDDDGEWIFCRRIFHARAKRFIYPKRGKVFRIKVKRKRR